MFIKNPGIFNSILNIQVLSRESLETSTELISSLGLNMLNISEMQTLNIIFLRKGKYQRDFYKLVHLKCIQFITKKILSNITKRTGCCSEV